MSETKQVKNAMVTQNGIACLTVSTVYEIKNRSLDFYIVASITAISI